MANRPKLQLGQRYCFECWRPCGVIEVDFGHGLTEHFGMLAYDSDRRWVSDCCLAGFDLYAGELDRDP